MDVGAYSTALRAGTGAEVDNVIVLRRADSTNLVARRIAAEFARDERQPPTVLIAALEQTQGRGRLGRSWSSPPGKGIYETLLLVVGAASLALLPLAVPVALARVLQSRIRRRVRIKWPNDLQIEGRKLGGVLIESTLRGAGPAVAMVGFGVNYGQREEELPTAWATSIERERAAAPPLAGLAGELAIAALESCRSPEERRVLAEYSEFSAHRPGDTLVFKLADGLVEGVFSGFESGGRLRLRGPHGERVVSAMEVVET